MKIWGKYIEKFNNTGTSELRWDISGLFLDDTDISGWLYRLNSFQGKKLISHRPPLKSETFEKSQLSEPIDVSSGCNASKSNPMGTIDLINIKVFCFIFAYPVQWSYFGFSIDEEVKRNTCLMHGPMCCMAQCDVWPLCSRITSVLHYPIVMCRDLFAFKLRCVDLLWSMWSKKDLSHGGACV